MNDRQGSPQDILREVDEENKKSWGGVLWQI